MWNIGSATIKPIFDADGSRPVAGVIPEATKASVAHDSWLNPWYIDDRGDLLAVVQAFLIELDGKKILVDPGVGSGKEYGVDFPGWSGLESNFLQNLGVPPKAIDFVICTHYHLDHIGWNTKQVDGKWLPTFSNARYILVEQELEYWLNLPEEEFDDDKKAFAEAIVPLLDSGLVDRVGSDYKITNGVSLIATPGHTPGHVSILVDSEGKNCVITGDVFHHPVQIAHPEWMSKEVQPAKAIATATLFLERFASTGTLIIGTHFAPPAAGYIERTAAGYTFRPITK